MQEEKEKKKKIIILIIVPLLILIILLLGYLIFLTQNRSKEINNYKIGGIQISDSKPSLPTTKKTRILGDDMNLVSKEQPYIYLKNDESNDVYMQFDVVENEKLIYSSDLIEPGKMDMVDIYSRLNKGQHLLEYHITTYNRDSYDVMLSGIKQIKEITISKGDQE